MYLIDNPFVSDKEKVICRIKQNQNINPDSLTVTRVLHQRWTVTDGFRLGNEHVRRAMSLQSLLKRLRRSAQDELDPRAKSLTSSDQTMSEFKSAVREVKAAGKAIEYTSGSRASVVRDSLHHILKRCALLQNCENADCTHIECEIKELKEDEYVLVEVFGRLWVNTLIDKAYIEADISSLAIAKVSSVPNAPESYNPPTQMAIVRDSSVT